MVSEKATTCPNCGCPLGAGDNAPRNNYSHEQYATEQYYDANTSPTVPKSSNKLIIGIIATVALLGIIAGGAYLWKNHEGNGILPSVTGSKSNEKEPTTWTYFKSVDDLTGNVTALNACIYSENSIPIDENGTTTKLFIYLIFGERLDTSKGYLNLEKVPGTTVMLSFSNKTCRFSDFQGKGLLATFDNGGVDNRWSGLYYSTQEYLVMHVSNNDRVKEFIDELKASQVAKIQVNIENVGMRTFTFKTKGLNWDLDI